MNKVRNLYYEVLWNTLSPEKLFDYRDAQFLIGAGLFGVYVLIQITIGSLEIDTAIKMGILNIVLLAFFGLLIGPQEKITAEKTKTVLPLAIIMSIAVLFVGNLLILNMPNSGLEEYSAGINSLPLSLKYMSVFIYAPIIEEIVFRGVIYRHMRLALNPILGALASSILFLIGHGTLAHIFPSIVFGVFLCLVYEYTGNIFINIGCHAIYNFMAFITGSIIYTNSIASFLFSIVCNFIIVSLITLLYLATMKQNNPLSKKRLYCPAIEESIFTADTELNN